ncbi:MAG: hypothetical protein O3C43_07580 [Verrucomicrobia bacterium]|nr:hypothetical protein [Verrucomicrobiota bacterium]
MSNGQKRTRTTPKKTAAISLTIREHHEIKNGRGYASYLVQGWKENGKWQRKKFKERKDAERFVALKHVELENQGRAQRMLLSPLTEEQHLQAIEAFDKLGETYSLAQAVEYFLENHRAPEFTIRFSDAVVSYLGERERDGLRDRSMVQSKSVLRQFTTFANDCLVHQVTPQLVESFLRGLRAKDGVSPAKRKTWNNYRNSLNHFFAWAGESDLSTQRPWIFNNPASQVRIYSAKQVDEQRDEISTTSPEDVQNLFSALMRWRGGVLVKCFALAYFAGIRPDGEMKRLAARSSELINLKTGVIKIPANVSKTKESRQVNISPNLRKWLVAFDAAPVIPTNFDRLMKQARAHYGLQHDETRHSFISYHVGLFRSVGDVALQAGNSESIVKKHYLNLHPKEEAEHFFSIVPDMENAKAVRNHTEDKPKLKAVG